MEIPTGYAEVTQWFNVSGHGVDDAACVHGVLAASYDADFADAVFTAWTNSILQIQSEDVIHLRTEVRDSAGGLHTSTGGPENGANSSSSQAPQVAYLYRKVTSLGGRQHRGRMFVVGVPETGVDAGGAIEPGLFSDVTTFGAAYLEQLGSFDCSMQLLHTDPLVTPDEVLQLVGQGLVATQRRRMRR